MFQSLSRKNSHFFRGKILTLPTKLEKLIQMCTYFYFLRSGFIIVN